MRDLNIEILTSEELRSTLLVKVGGYLDADTVQIFNDRISEDMSEQVDRVILLMRDLIYISSAGIGSIMGWAKRMDESKGSMILVSPSDKVYKILDLLGFTRVLKILEAGDERIRDLGLTDI